MKAIGTEENPVFVEMNNGRIFVDVINMVKLTPYSKFESFMKESETFKTLEHQLKKELGSDFVPVYDKMIDGQKVVFVDECIALAYAFEVSIPCYNWLFNALKKVDEFFELSNQPQEKVAEKAEEPASIDVDCGSVLLIQNDSELFRISEETFSRINIGFVVFKDGNYITFDPFIALLKRWDFPTEGIEPDSILPLKVIYDGVVTHDNIKAGVIEFNKAIEFLRSNVDKVGIKDVALKTLIDLLEEKASDEFNHQPVVYGTASLIDKDDPRLAEGKPEVQPEVEEPPYIEVTKRIVCGNLVEQIIRYEDNKVVRTTVENYK